MDIIENKQEIGEFLFKTRVKKSISIREISNKTGIHRSTIYAMEKSEYNYNFDFLVVYTRYLGNKIFVIGNPSKGREKSEIKDAGDIKKIVKEERKSNKKSLYFVAKKVKLSIPTCKKFEIKGKTITIDNTLKFLHLWEKLLKLE